METKEVLKEAINDVKKERKLIRKEGRFILGLKYAVKVKDPKLVKRFDRKAARYESRINQFEEKILKITDFLRKNFPNWNNALLDTEQKIKLYNENILKRVSYIDGTIPGILKQGVIKWDQVNDEVDTVMDEGVRPLAVLLEHLEDEFERIAAESMVVEQVKEKEEEETFEASLRKQPFLILFHSANQKQYVNKILASRHALPEYYMGRKLEYAFEVDYFWIEHTRNILVGRKPTGEPIMEPKTKISGFLGHAPHGMTPRNAAKILNMRAGETNAENILKRKGILLPKWILSRIGRVKLAVEVKSGWGSDKRALDELVKLVKMHHLENNIIFYCFSVWVLDYLKARLPNALTIVICYRAGNSVMQFPFNRPFESLKKWGLVISPDNLGFVDVLSSPAKKSEKGIIKQIGKSTSADKLHFAGRVKSREQFDWLVRHGARGAMVWADAEKLIKWMAEGQAEQKEEIASEKTTAQS